MHVFIDESGSFSGFDKRSLGVVAALSIPDTSLPKLTRKYNAIRGALPKEGGEVKGKLLTEGQVAKSCVALTRYHVILEATVIDVGAHSQTL